MVDHPVTLEALAAGIRHVLAEITTLQAQRAALQPDIRSLAAPLQQGNGGLLTYGRRG